MRLSAPDAATAAPTAAAAAGGFRGGAARRKCPSATRGEGRGAKRAASTMAIDRVTSGPGRVLKAHGFSEMLCDMSSEVSMLASLYARPHGVGLCSAAWLDELESADRRALRPPFEPRPRERERAPAVFGRRHVSVPRWPLVPRIGCERDGRANQVAAIGLAAIGAGAGAGAAGTHRVRITAIVFHGSHAPVSHHRGAWNEC